MRVLLISAPIGAGHMRAAQAVEGALKRQRADIETEITNIFSFIAPNCGQAILKGYIKVLESIPWLYGKLYGWGNNSRLALGGRELISRYLAQKMYEYIKNYRPSIIICTHATSAGLAAYLMRKERIKTPLIAVVTDYVVHRLWVYPEINQYFVADAALSEFLKDHGVPSVRSQATGIPVEHFFRVPSDKKQVLGELGLNSACKTILVMGGGAGLLPMNKLLKALDTINARIQVIVIAGNNISLYNELKNLETELQLTIKLLGYIDNVHELMSAADILISKPGGMTTAEAMCRKLPMILYNPIPGQEEANAEFLIRKGVAVSAYSPQDAARLIEELLFNNTQQLIRLKQNISILQKPLAADYIAKAVLSGDFP